MLKKITKSLSSLRFTIVLISLLGVIFAIGLWIPQKRLLKSIYFEWQRNSPALVSVLDSLGLTSIYTSPITLTLWLLFFTNLSLVIWQRIPVIKHRIALSPAKIADPAMAAGYPFRRSYPLPAGLDGDRVIALLKKGRYTVLGDARGFYGIRNRLAPVAFMLFHLSFFLILLGGLTTVYTEFQGYVDLAQGESFQGDIGRYNTSPEPILPVFGSPPRTTFKVQSVVPHVVRNTPTGISVVLLDGEGKSHDVDINRPYKTADTSFVFKHLGLSPLFVLQDPGGKEIGGAYIKLNVLQMKPDNFALGGFSFTATFYPDFVWENGKRASRSMEFNNPVFFISAQQGGKTLGEGLLKKGGVLQFGGYRLAMPDMPYWIRFYAVKQQGLSILYAGFALAAIGVIWRLLFYRREILGAVREEEGGRMLVVAGRSEYYKSLAEDEFSAMFDKLLGRTSEE